MEPSRNKYLLYFVIVFLLGCFVCKYIVSSQVRETAREIRSCISEREYPADKITLSGVLIIEEQEHYSLLSLPDMRRIELPDDILEVAESPDKQLFIAKQGESVYDRISVFDAKGERINVFQRGENWNKEWHLNYHLQWLDQQNFVVNILPAGSKLMINALTGEKQEIIFPDGIILNFDANMSTGFVIFHPQLGVVFYKSLGNLLELGLYNVNTTMIDVFWAKTSINLGPYTALPSWSPNEEYLAIPIARSNYTTDLHIITRAGFDEIRLTDFEKLYNSPYEIRIQAINWSPDSTSVALNVHVEQEKYQKWDEEGYLVVANIENEKVIDYCKLVTYPLIWSPDGKYVASDGVIIDLENKKSYEITQGKIYGWLQSP